MSRSPSPYTYLSPAILTCRVTGSKAIRFRGRVLRHEVTGALRFFVNRTRRGKPPESWPHPKEWTDDFDLKDVEWIGQQPVGGG